MSLTQFFYAQIEQSGETERREQCDGSGLARAANASAAVALIAKEDTSGVVLCVSTPHYEFFVTVDVVRKVYRVRFVVFAFTSAPACAIWAKGCLAPCLMKYSACFRARNSG